jgi:hypothetical protein
MAVIDPRAFLTVSIATHPNSVVGRTAVEVISHRRNTDMTTEWGSGSDTVGILVNGECGGTAASTETLGAVASRISDARGLRTFSVYVNGQKMETSAGGKTLAELGATSVELVAKDARGSHL